ncbi:MAG: glutamine--tRNA ligase [Candidatus Sulcia muelleri]|uniref:Glutamine--tRNA ligase n=2 Tax=cellular organisms TaxID=131567 RepID=A8Z5Q3_KARMG|nr:glutaminyl-tRNA synthetase [Candidatus Karelsulcia muelleri GWSS]MBS0018835.1 glutamine--tRNA ligase [Candidatus Karelsulcia muelleri]MCJ7422597.1 glutamine--tRNA ligase [Candidatus Karelsulcia muelleri]
MKIKDINIFDKIIEKDLESGFPKKKLLFRFPPEPNGYLHIGHAKSIYLNFKLAEKYKASVILRFDDTNPIEEEKKFIYYIKKDIFWLGFKWNKVTYASNYFYKLYDLAKVIIEKGKAYVDDQKQYKIQEQRKNPFEDGIESPYRNRSIKENIFLFKKMKNGYFDDGDCVLRAKIDMKSPNMNLRDPIMYRIIKKKLHYRTKNKWCIYPTYDWTHGQSDYIENISHSLCSFEFENHKQLYNWYIYNINKKNSLTPRQYEFSRLNLNYNVLSKRKLQILVKQNIVNGWDDPRMPTISGLRRRGYTPESIKYFIKKIGISKRYNHIDISILEFSIRKHLNKISSRVMVVINPLLIIIENYPTSKVEWLNAENNPEDIKKTYRKIPFSRFLYIESEDFMEKNKKNFFRLSLGKEVRLKNAYILKANNISRNIDGSIKSVYCTYDKNSLSKTGLSSKRKIKSTLHWVSKIHALKIKINIFDKIFIEKIPEKYKKFIDFLNHDSLKTKMAYAETSLRTATIKDKFQFQRIGYFCLDKTSNKKTIIFNKTVSLK